MRTLFYAYRRKLDGADFFHGARPYCTKAAAKNGVRQAAGLRWVKVPLDQSENGRTWRYRSKAEMDAILAAEFDLITYEMTEVRDA